MPPRGNIIQVARYVRNVCKKIPKVGSRGPAFVEADDQLSQFDHETRTKKRSLPSLETVSSPGRRCHQSFSGNEVGQGSASMFCTRVRLQIENEARVPRLLTIVVLPFLFCIVVAIKLL